MLTTTTTLMLYGKTTPEIEAAERALNDAEIVKETAMERFSVKYPEDKYPPGHPRTIALLMDDDDINEAWSKMDDAETRVWALRQHLIHGRQHPDAE